MIFARSGTSGPARRPENAGRSSATGQRGREARATPLLLVADHAEEGAALVGVFRSLDTLRRVAVNDAEDAATLLAFGDHYLHRIRRRAEDPADFGDVFDAAEHVDGIAVAHHDDEDVA